MALETGNYIDDLVIILTDGVTEARNKEGEFIKKETNQKKVE